MLPFPSPMLTVSKAVVVSSSIFLGGKTVTYTAGTTQTIALTDLLDSSGSSITLLQNDVIVVSMSRRSTSNTGAASVMPVSGYTMIGTNLYANDVSDTNFGVSYKFMGSTPDVSVDLPGTGGGGMAVTIIVLRGVNTTTPLDVAAVQVASSGSTNRAVNPGAITPVTAGSLITVHGAGAASAAGTNYTNPGDLSSTTNHFLAANVTGASFVGTGAKEDWVSGAFDPLTFTGSNGAAGDSWAAVTVAWRPA